MTNFHTDNHPEQKFWLRRIFDVSADYITKKLEAVKIFVALDVKYSTANRQPRI